MPANSELIFPNHFDSELIQMKLNERHNKRLEKYTNRGKEEGQVGLPKVSRTTHSESEYEIRGTYREDQSDLQGYLHLLNTPVESLKRLQQERKEILDNYQEKIVAKINEKKRNRDSDIKELEKEKDEKLEDLENEKNEFTVNWHTFLSRFKKVTEEIGREELIIHIKNRWVVLTSIFSLGLFEIPFNASVFLTFLLSNELTFLLSLLMIVALPVSAYYCGLCLKQMGENKNLRIHFVVVITLVSAYSTFIGIMRANFMRSEHLATSQINNSTIVFILMSVLIFTAGIIISYLHHDESQRLTEIIKLREKEKENYMNGINTSRMKILNVEDKYREKIDKRNKMFQDEKLEIENQLAKINESVHNEISQHNSIYDTIKGFESRIIANYQETIARYRAENDKYISIEKRNEWPPILNFGTSILESVNKLDDNISI